MSQPASTNLAKRFKRPQKPASNDLIAIIRLLAEPTILTEIRTQQIISTNTAFIELSGYSHHELENNLISQLLGGWEDEFLKPNSTHFYTHTVLTLKQKSGSSLPVKLEMSLLPPENLFAIITFESQGNSSHQPNQHWQYLQEFASAHQHDNLKDAATQILKALQRITEVDQVGLYLASSSTPRLDLLFSLGDAQWMPTTISSSELSNLQSFFVWQYGKRQPSELHRKAQHAHIACIATHPLGNKEALIGLLMLAGASAASNAMLQSQIAFAAEILVGIIKKHHIAKEYENLQTAHSWVKTTYWALLQNNLCAVLLLTPGGLVEDLNPSAEKILGYSRKEVIGQAINRVLVGSDTLLSYLPPQIDAPKLFENDIHLYHRKGDSFLAHAQIIPILVENQLNSYLIFLSDLSEQEQLQEQRRQLEQRAILGELTAVFAHEVRNPINNISTGLELLSMNISGNDPNKPAEDRLSQDVDRLSELVKSVLSYTKPIEYTMLTVHLKLFFQSLLERMRPRFERQNITAQIEVEANCPPIRGNPRALEQVFSNLLVNAIQAMSDAGGQVYVKIRRASNPGALTLENRDFVEINIIDTGSGIPPEIQDHLFQPFFTTKEGGTGIGLAISKRIISAHKGTIRLNSFPGGTVFQVLLPIMEREAN